MSKEKGGMLDEGAGTTPQASLDSSVIQVTDQPNYFTEEMMPNLREIPTQTWLDVAKVGYGTMKDIADADIRTELASTQAYTDTMMGVPPRVREMYADVQVRDPIEQLMALKDKRAGEKATRDWIKELATIETAGDYVENTAIEKGGDRGSFQRVMSLFGELDEEDEEKGDLDIGNIEGLETVLDRLYLEEKKKEKPFKSTPFEVAPASIDGGRQIPSGGKLEYMPSGRSLSDIDLIGDSGQDSLERMFQKERKKLLLGEGFEGIVDKKTVHLADGSEVYLPGKDPRRYERLVSATDKPRDEYPSVSQVAEYAVREAVDPDSEENRLQKIARERYLEGRMESGRRPAQLKIAAREKEDRNVDELASILGEDNETLSVEGLGPGVMVIDDGKVKITGEPRRVERATEPLLGSGFPMDPTRRKEESLIDDLIKGSEQKILPPWRQRLEDAAEGRIPGTKEEGAPDDPYAPSRGVVTLPGPGEGKKDRTGKTKRGGLASSFGRVANALMLSKLLGPKEEPKEDQRAKAIKEAAERKIRAQYALAQRARMQSFIDSIGRSKPQVVRVIS